MIKRTHLYICIVSALVRLHYVIDLCLYACLCVYIYIYMCVFVIMFVCMCVFVCVCVCEYLQ